MAASDIGDLGAARQLLEDAVEGGEPGTDQMVVVARAEEARHRAKHAAGLLAPGDPAAGAKRLLDLWLIVEQRRHKIEASQHVDGAVLFGEHHRLLRRKREFPRRRIVGEIVRGRLVRQPLAQVSLVGAGCGGEFARCHRPLGVKRLVQPERIADPHHRDARCAAEIAQ